jgi:hypothetical protein
MKAKINPFTREAEITIVNKNVTHIVKLYFDDLDEWQGFKVDGRCYDAHFLFEDSNHFFFDVYLVKEGIQNNYDLNLVKQLTITLPNSEQEWVCEQKEERTWVDEGSENGLIFFDDKKCVLDYIRAILKDDKDIMDGRGYKTIDDASEDDLFEIAHLHYAISEI